MIRFGTGGRLAVIGDGFTKQNIQIPARALCGSPWAVKQGDSYGRNHGIII